VNPQSAVNARFTCEGIVLDEIVARIGLKMRSSEIVCLTDNTVW
jgi:hypothetical protein